MNCDINTLNSTTLNKISFARVMLHNPEIILIDDFTASMDLYDQTLVFEIIKEIKNDKSILFATNDLELSEFYSDRIILLDNGKVTFNGSISNLESQLNDVQKYRFTFKRIVPSEFWKAF